MIQLTEGQCGLCSHFGESKPASAQLVQIRTSKEAPADLKDTCGANASISLEVTAISSCSSFEPALKN